ncbi:lipopolysaccharide biosynthesis protein [Paenibacillus xylanilyticus]|uniref:Sugar translocase n=1 Tax=Paenibacillus xylanilyticus TaxID=248903 RepID=A0A7Y6BUK3_9BACL|nr:sugar translocase [Paenibacillus xylanilyticus]NUU75298.1 sugar translocase [Paenibacillus xylanilyticus]
MLRTKKALVNIVVALFGQILGLFVSFIARIYFVKYLGAEYLGLNGLFTNIISILSLVELGIGPAIVYSLYRPLAENDIQKVKSLMKLYKKAYTLIGIIIFIVGLLVIPILPLFVTNKANIIGLEPIFVLFVINASISYFFSYKRNLIIADQYRYVATIYRYSFFIFLNVLQIFILFLTKNYLIFLIMMILCTLLENIFVARRADRMYPFLKKKNALKLDKGTILEIKRNTSALIFHKIGGVVINSTDNILISINLGVIWVGLYSNYLLIITALHTMIGQIFTAVTATVGNLVAVESKKKSLFMFQVIYLANFWIYGLCLIGLFLLINPFMNFWLGKQMLISMDVVSFILINFYIQGMRKTVLTFREASGLYWNDRYKPLFEVTVNLIVSIILVPHYGLPGIFIGTIVSTMTICFWLEPYVLYKHGFHSPLKPYFLKYIYYLIVLLVAGVITHEVTSLIAEESVISFIFIALISLSLPNVIFLIFFYRTKEFQYWFNLFKSVFKKRMQKK